MVERYNPFATTEYRKASIRKFHQEEARKDAERKAIEAAAELNMNNIREKAKWYAVLQPIADYANEERQRDLIRDSNTFDLPSDDYLAKMHKMMDERSGHARGKHFAAEDQHERPYRPGWGPWGMETREQTQWRVDRAVRLMINRALDLAEEWDNKPREWEQLELF